MYTSMPDKVRDALAECEAGTSPMGATTMLRPMLQHARNAKRTDEVAALRSIARDLRAGKLGQDGYAQRLRGFLVKHYPDA